MQAATQYPTALHDAIIRHDLFDAQFYRRNYGFVSKSDAWLLDHFCRNGMLSGWLPKLGFDPLLYRLKYPGCGANVVQHFVKSGCANPIYANYHEAFPEVAATKTGSDLRFSGRPDFDKKAEVVTNRANSRNLAKPIQTTFDVNNQTYRFAVPSPDSVLKQLSENRPLAIARLPHILWDTICATETMAKIIAQDVRCHDFCDEQITLMARRFSYEMLPEKSGLTENFHSELHRMLMQLRRNDGLHISLSFKGYPTSDHRLFSNALKPGAVQQRRLEVFARYFDNYAPILDAMIWKQWVIAGAVTELPELVRVRPVVLIGPEHVRRLDERWQLPHFSRIAIPNLKAHEQRYQLLDACRLQVRKAVEISSTRGLPLPVFLSQCGGTLATWLIIQLFEEFRDVFYFDLGQALDAWFLDTVPKPRCWTKVYGTSIIENGFETYYRELLGREYSAFAKSFH